MDNKRTGSTHRINPDRYFHVMNQGWYVYTREGIGGPYEQRHDAESYLTTVISDINFIVPLDSNDTWRM